MKNPKDADRHAFPQISSVLPIGKGQSMRSAPGTDAPVRAGPSLSSLLKDVRPHDPTFVRTPFIFRPSRLSSGSRCAHVCLSACTYIYLWNSEISNRVLSVNFVSQDRPSHDFPSVFRGTTSLELQLYPTN